MDKKVQLIKYLPSTVYLWFANTIITINKKRLQVSQLAAIHTFYLLEVKKLFCSLWFK
jgi:hypothetical protein